MVAESLLLDVTLPTSCFCLNLNRGSQTTQGASDFYRLYMYMYLSIYCLLFYCTGETLQHNNDCQRTTPCVSHRLRSSALLHLRTDEDVLSASQRTQRQRHAEKRRLKSFHTPSVTGSPSLCSDAQHVHAPTQRLSIILMPVRSCPAA